MYEAVSLLPELPKRMRDLPICPQRNVPVPWFVDWVDGKPEFRAMDHQKLVRAVRERLCWVCGSRLGSRLAFVIGPMCALNRVSAEPPAHLECAEYSAVTCPFLSQREKRRRTGGLEGAEMGEMHIDRQPGVTLVWLTRSYKVVNVGKASASGVLFEIGEPESVLWYAHGRPATRDEVMASIDSGYPLLEKQAESDKERRLLQSMRKRALDLVPA